VRRSVHDIVLGILAAGPPGRLLDVPAGGERLRAGAEKLGYQPVGVDLFLHPGFRGVLADACTPLPFRDASFDVVVSIEGIEHFENQSAFLRECARVMRPGGRLVLTTPNILHLGARLSAFLTGQRLLKQGFVNEVTTLRAREGDRLYHGHAFLIDVFRLRYLLRVCGLDLRELHGTRRSTTSLALAPLVPLLWLATRYTLWSGRRRQQRRGRPVTPLEVEREVARLALSPATLFSRGLVAVASQPPSGRQ
jgi:SAM-dependent methyltransferase